METVLFTYGDKEYSLETGRIARQATSAVMVRQGATSVLVTLVADKKGMVNSFFPLSVHYIEKTYAAGRIPGGFFRREARPSEKEVLTSRLIDRPLRPLFPKEFRNEVQIICTVMSTDKNVDPDICALLGASAALALSGLPAKGVLAAARVGYDSQDNYLLNPTYSALKDSRLDMVVAGTSDAVLMVESEADRLSEQVMLGAVEYAHQNMQTAVKAIMDLAAKVPSPKWEWQSPQEQYPDLRQALADEYGSRIKEIYTVADKLERRAQFDVLEEEALAKHADAEDEENMQAVKILLEDVHAEVMRAAILKGENRIDGRDTKTVRPITVDVGILPSVHGSALFTRGETQALVTATLAGKRNAQIIDALEGEYKEHFLLHYNFPPFSVGEISFIGAPKRREVGHGRLALRALRALLPKEEEFPYMLRVVSEITESNGSSSMATVCGASLALMDAGVPLKEAVAGVAMGLIKEEEKYAILTDIMGDEDHLGDMDFKVAGTKNGVTALQMDIKIAGVTPQIMQEALQQAHEARMLVLTEMDKVLPAARSEISPLAPYMLTMSIKPDKTRDVIGKGGSVIRGITERTRADIDIDEGRISIYGEDQASAVAAQQEIERIVAEPEVGMVYDGKVVRIIPAGAIVEILFNHSGLVHISQIAKERVQKVEDYVKVGQPVRVKVLAMERGRIRLSIKEAMPSL